MSFGARWPFCTYRQSLLSDVSLTFGSVGSERCRSLAGRLCRFITNETLLPSVVGDVVVHVRYWNEVTPPLHHSVIIACPGKSLFDKASANSDTSIA